MRKLIFIPFGLFLFILISCNTSEEIEMNTEKNLTLPPTVVPIPFTTTMIVP